MKHVELHAFQRFLEVRINDSDLFVGLLIKSFCIFRSGLLQTSGSFGFRCAEIPRSLFDSGALLFLGAAGTFCIGKTVFDLFSSGAEDSHNCFFPEDPDNGDKQYEID